MQEWQWYVLHPNGTVDLDVSDDPSAPDIVTIPRAKVGHIRKFGLMLEAADELVRVFEEQVRTDVGMTAQAMELLAKLRSDGEQTVESMVSAPDLLKMEAEYASKMQVYLLSPDNPYPPIYIELIRDMADREIADADLPMWALGQAPITAIVNHWQTAPMILGTAPVETPPVPRPRREPQDRKPKST